MIYWYPNFIGSRNAPSISFWHRMGIIDRDEHNKKEASLDLEVSQKFARYLQDVLDESVQKNYDHSRDINEDINQSLASVKLQIGRLVDQAEGNADGELADALRKIDGELARIIARLREISYSLEEQEITGRLPSTNDENHLRQISDKIDALKKRKKLARRAR
jgi:hypothetical protein